MYFQCIFRELVTISWYILNSWDAKILSCPLASIWCISWSSRTSRFQLIHRGQDPPRPNRFERWRLRNEVPANPGRSSTGAFPDQEFRRIWADSDPFRSSSRSLRRRRPSIGNSGPCFPSLIWQPPDSGETRKRARNVRCEASSRLPKPG